MRRIIIPLVTMWGCPALPTVNMKNQERQPIMPSVPHGPMASGSSFMIIVVAAFAPPSNTEMAVKKMNTPATTITVPCTMSV